MRSATTEIPRPSPQEDALDHRWEQNQTTTTTQANPAGIGVGREGDASAIRNIYSREKGRRLLPLLLLLLLYLRVRAIIRQGGWFSGAAPRKRQPEKCFQNVSFSPGFERPDV